ncbi:tRNA (guanine-N(7)-)-methyltransferase (tRNA(m7G46)-methyltransferase) [Polyrhizophydium stewartii]|uniref:tRNA (Guanine-N(7)-)-methyltransferase (tRNA(m7G46)-methyltransferase) n=1 Tax=Polyrhizophydium stewartii TaxID=2732419 RepID=A0ABR4NBE7_9FUNG
MLVHHPRLAVALALLPLLAWASPLLRRVVLNAAAALALLVLAGLWTAARDARLGRSELARLRDRSGFFLTEADARRVAARHGAPVRQFPLSSTAYWERLGTLRRKETAPARTPQYIANPQIQASLDDLVAFVARDFVASWFAHISSDPEPAFVGQVKLALHHVLAELKMRIDRVDMAQLIVARVAPALAAHARDMSAAEKMLRAERRQKTPIGQDELDNLLARYYRPKGGLHPAVFVNRDLANKPERSSRLELEHLRSRIKPIVPLLLQRSDSGSRVLVTLLREILVCRILQPVSEMLSDPDYWSQTFGSLAETLIQQEQSLGRKFGDAYSREDTQDAIGFEPGRTGVHGAPNVEELVKKLMASTTVGDASRIREQISDTLKRKRAEIVGFDKDDIFNGMQVASIREYIGQLQDAQKRADKHIASLSRDKSKRSHLNDAESAGLARPPFSKVLEDAQMLTFFSDYMSTTARLRLIVFFMRAQDALRRLGISDFNPRELEATISTQAALSESADFMTVCSDIHTLCKDYFVRDAPSRIGDVSPATTRGLQALGEVLSHGNETQSREALFSQGDLRFLLQAVRETYEAMERDDYPSFLKSPAYARMANALLAESTSQPRPSAASNLTPAQPGTPSASQGASKPGEDSPMLPPRTSHEAEWSSLDMIAAAPGDADAADPPEDSQRRIRGRSLFGSVFKGMLKSPQKPPITGSQATAAVAQSTQAASAAPVVLPAPTASDVTEEHRPTLIMPARPDGSSSLEGDLHVAANVDDGQFAAQSRKRSSWLFGDDRLFGSREDVSKDAKRTDSADLPQQQGSLTTGGAAASVNRRHSNPGIPPSATAAPDPLAQQEVETGKSGFMKRPARTRGRNEASTLERAGYGLAVPEQHRLSGGRARSSSLDTGRTPEFVVTEAQVDQVDRSNHRLSSGSTRSSAGASGLAFIGAASSASSSAHNLTPFAVSVTNSVPVPTQPRAVLGSRAAQLPLRSDGSVPAGGSLSPDGRQPRQRRATSPMSAQLVDDTVRYNSDDPSGDGGADSEPEGAQFFQVGGGQLGDDDDDDDARMLLGEASILTLSGVPRSRNELLARFRNDQDILPTMIAIPLRVMQINDDLAALRGELDENMRQRAALDASPRRSLHDLAAPAASSDRTNDASSQSRQAKLLHFAGLGIEEAMKRLLAEKRRFELDELDNVIMPERVSISVGESQTASSDDGKDFAIYPVQVQRVNVDGVVSGWYVMRRYREFWSLHATLRARYPSIVMQYDMPGKMLNNIIKLRKQTLEMRRTALEKYLQNLSRHVEICRTVEFRQFLCHPNISRLLFSNEGSDHPMRRSLLKNIFQTVDGGIDSFRQKLRVPPSLHTQSTLQHQQDPQHQHHDVHFDQPVHHQHEHLQPIELRQMQQEQDRQAQLQLRQQPQQQLSMHQSFSQSAHTADAGLSGSLVQPLSQSQTSACSFLSDPGAGYGTPPAAFSAAFPSGASPPFVGGGQTRFAGIYGAQVAAEGSSSSLPLSMAGSEAGPAQTSATDAMIDLFIELFELKEKNNWLRRQAVVIFLQQLFGGTVERRVNESLRWAVSEDNTAYVLSSVLNMFWPKGVWNPQFGPPRTAEAKRRTFTDTQSKLAMLLPEYVGGMVGRQNARRGALRWCGLFQNRLLNQHLIYTLLDDILGALFPEAVK